jgi:predicted ArsR family transcriptional regulator
VKIRGDSLGGKPAAQAASDLAVAASDLAVAASDLPAVIDRTRDAVARLVLERGPQTAAVLAARLDLSAAAIRRHLDALVVDGLLVECEPRRPIRRGRGRPARTYAVTDAGRAAFPHAYDDLATTALRYLREVGGDAAVVAFAEHRASSLERLLAPAVHAATSGNRPEALASALTTQGYAADTEAVSVPGISGVQVCQHHCPIAHVAIEFPQLCEAETRSFERLLGTYVQRLATIAHGDGICTTHIPSPPSATSSAKYSARTGSTE